MYRKRATYPLFTLYFIILLSIVDCAKFNFFNCQHFQTWEVDYNQTNLVYHAKLLHDYLYAWQHSSWRCSKFGIESYFANFGIGNGYLRSSMVIERALESGKIYRPGEGYFWALNAQNCTYNRTSFDCYTREFSSCGLNTQNLIDAVVPMDKDDRITELGKMLGGPTNIDICTLSKILKKSMAWTAGQYVSYILKPKVRYREQIHDRIKGIFTNLDEKTQSTITVHYRTGQPDGWRKVISLDTYMDAVKKKAAELAMDGRPVAIVYLASQDNENVFHNISFMQEKYGGNYTYRFLLPMAKGIDSSQEIEIELSKHPNIPREPYVIEFLADLQLMVQADCFIGSVSTIYMVTMLLRYAKYPYRNKGYTCLMNLESQLICEDDVRKYEIYKKWDYWWTADVLSNGGETHMNAFLGGVPF